MKQFLLIDQFLVIPDEIDIVNRFNPALALNSQVPLLENQLTALSRCILFHRNSIVGAAVVWARDEMLCDLLHVR
jgi:hypothetical protein